MAFLLGSKLRLNLDKKEKISVSPRHETTRNFSLGFSWRKVNQFPRHPTAIEKKKNIIFWALKSDGKIKSELIFSHYNKREKQVKYYKVYIFSIYTKSMKFVLVFGVATTLHAVHRCLSYDVTSKLRVQASLMFFFVFELELLIKRGKAYTFGPADYLLNWNIQMKEK